ncbi:MAG: hypothetical protein SangKO_011790 [Sandaracinaceae bacterium]
MDSVAEIADYIRATRGDADADLWAAIAANMRPELVDYLTVPLLAQMGGTAELGRVTQLFVWLCRGDDAVVEVRFVYAPDNELEVVLDGVEGFRALQTGKFYHEDIGEEVSADESMLHLFFRGTPHLKSLLEDS